VVKKSEFRFLIHKHNSRFTMKKILLVLLVLLALVAVLLLIGRYKPEDTIKPRPPDVKIEAKTLLADFLSDEAGANEKYLNKTLAVSGTVSTFKKDDRGNLAITLDGGSQAGGVKCKLDKMVEHRRREFQIGENITLKCICMGYIGYVEMVGCVEVE
jgi:hypothetical protein